MSKKRFGFILLVVITLLVLTGCNRSATRAPLAAPTSEIPFPGDSQSQEMADILAGTQTAQASGQSKEMNPQSSEVPTQAVTPVTTSNSPAVPTPTSGVPETYRVQKDEFPFCLARRFDVNPVDLLAVNGLDLESYVAIGTTLKIPRDSKFPGERALKSHPVDYTVLDGDSINKIACAFGDVSPEAILAANSLQSDAKLEIGQVLHIP